MAQMDPSKPKMAVGRTQQDLYRLVCTLSGACRVDGNVLKDSQLVDLLESQARAILQARRQQRRKSVVAAASKSVEAPTISPQRTKLIKKLADANAENGKDGVVSKRRKLSFETEKQRTLKSVESPIKPAMPRFFETNPAEDFLSHAATSVSVFNAASLEHMSQRSGAMSPSQFYKSQVTPFKSLDRAAVATDLSASMASTVASTSAGYYDDMYDDLSIATDPRYRRYHSPSLSSRGRLSPSSELTQSVDSIDWSPTDDEEEEEGKEPNVVELVRPEETKPEATTEQLFVSMTEPAAVVDAEQKSSTEVVMQVLYGIMQHDQNYKWLVDPENQARVAKLVDYHQRQQGDSASSSSSSEELQAQLDALIRENSRIQSENARLAEVNQMSACDVEEQKKRVSELVLKLERSSRVSTSSDSELAKRLAATQEELLAQETCRREAESFFQSELSAKSEMAASLQKELLDKDGQISTLMKRVGDISASVATKRDENDMSSSTSSLRRSSLSPQKSSSTSTESVDENMILHLREVNIAREMEVKRLRGVLMEKDREICNLYMHLSTKKKLVEEISTRFLEQLKASGAGKECSLDELNLNLDMFLFKNVVEKQKTVDELTAALGVMEREVESLEARADKFESENYRLKNAEEDLGLALESANSELVRISAENELMESSLKEKQTRVRNLMLYLEEKEEQIVRLKDSTQHNLLL
jgi:hypothetical protein